MARSRAAIYEQVNQSDALVTTTAASGTGWVKVGNTEGGPVNCKTIVVYNKTAVSLHFAKGTAAGTAPTSATKVFEIPAGGSFPFRALSSSAELYVREASGTSTGAKVIYSWYEK